MGSHQQGHCRTGSQCRTNESLVRRALQKRKLQTLELRLRAESHAFRLQNTNWWPLETESSRANARNVRAFPVSLPTRQNNWTAWLGRQDSNCQMTIFV